MTTVGNIYEYLDENYHFNTQESWDNSGLLCGDISSAVTRCLVTLDVTLDAVKEAALLGAQLIISHHPLIFTPVKSIPAGTALHEAIRGGIAVISAHTCFDKADGGTNDTLCGLLGFTQTEISDNGIFRTAQLTSPTTTAKLANHISDALNTSVRYSMPDKAISRVSVCTGAGGDALYKAAACGADCLITGEAKYHEFLDAQAIGLAILAAGHFETEEPAMEALRRRLARDFPEIMFEKFSPAPPISTVMR
ncbi:MAG: Nif3-like dinuclear metal center hexameric protein [Clostridia bacterium]|nr:Nif3-like dinuclear metal center hexameric protein [Clostridia bacterium]